MDAQEIVVTVVGDGEVGKTCLVQRFIGQEFTGNYVPTVLETVHKSFGNYDLVVQDTAGQEQYSRLRPLAYPKTNVFVVCFALNNEVSYKNVKTIWRPELLHHRPNAPMILVGTKLDAENRKVTRKEGLQLQREISAASYTECSARQAANVQEVLDKAVEAYLKHSAKSGKRSNCNLL